MALPLLKLNFSGRGKKKRKRRSGSGGETDDRYGRRRIAELFFLFFPLKDEF